MRALALSGLMLLGFVQQPVFKTGVEVVTIPITVTNATRDQLITTGLLAGDFRVLEDDVQQPITSLTQERRPVSLCVVVDASGSMDVSGRHRRGVQALESTVRGLEKEDELSIVRFASHADVTLRWTRGVDPRRVSWRLDPDAGTVANSSIADAVKVALGQVEHAANSRRVILVISDGYENTSATPLAQVAKSREQSEVVLYGFGVGGPVERGYSGAPLMNILPRLVGETGGVYWNITTPTEADFAAMSLLNELKYQYLLAYSPTKPFDGKYRRIKVETTVQGLAVRHRGGYLAMPLSQ